MKRNFSNGFTRQNLIRKISGGFTLIEIVLSFSIIVLIFGIATPIYQDYQIRNGIDTTVNVIVENLRRSQTLSEAVDGDSTWGVNVAGSNITLFKGLSFASRDTTFDDISDIPVTMSATGLTEIVFSKLTGLPNTVGVLNLSTTGNVRTISINEKGTLIY